MKFKATSFVLSVLLLAISRLSVAQIEIAPVAPRSQDTIVVSLKSQYLVPPGWSGTLEWAHPSVSMTSDRTIVVTLHDVSITFGGGLVSDFEWAIGQLPSGTYNVRIDRQSDAGTTVTLAQSAFTVQERMARVMPLTNYSDLWWVPTESGWGISIHQHSSGIIFAVWYVYGENGQPIWYVMPGGKWLSSYLYSGDIYKTSGPYFGGNFDPSNVSVTLVGSGSFVFTSYSTAQFDCTVSGTTNSKKIVRQPF